MSGRPNPRPGPLMTQRFSPSMSVRFTRSMSLKAGLIMLLAGGLVSTSPRSRQTARGTVFDDLNRNGLLDEGEPGLEGIRVSNGEVVVLTDANGRWSLEVGEEEVLFITKPSGWATPVNEHMLPRFYYLHQPAGSPPGMRYAGIDPTGPLPESIDFPLTRREESSVFEVLLFSDPQPQSEVELDYVRDDVINELIGSPAAFGMTLGDIMFDDPLALPTFQTLSSPASESPGTTFRATTSSTSKPRMTVIRWRRSSASSVRPTTPSSTAKRCLSCSTTSSTAEEARVIRGMYEAMAAYVANLGQRQLRWLEQELSHVPPEKLVFLANARAARDLLLAPVEGDEYPGPPCLVRLADRPAEPLFGCGPYAHDRAPPLRSGGWIRRPRHLSPSRVGDRFGVVVERSLR